MRCAETKPGILIIGYGNPLRGDDGVGWIAAERIEAGLHERSAVIMTMHQLTPELAGAVADAHLVVFIDASMSDPPGTIACRVVVPDDLDARAFTHSLVPERLVTFAGRTFGRPPRALVYTVGGEFFGYREGLSDVVEAAMPGLVRRVIETVRARSKSMHEFSIAQALMDLALAHRPEGSKLRALKVRAGPLRGIDPVAMQWAWESVRGGECAFASLDLTVLPWRLRCGDCGKEWTSAEFEFRCACGSDRLFPLGGDELVLESLNVDDPVEFAKEGVPCRSR